MSQSPLPQPQTNYRDYYNSHILTTPATSTSYEFAGEQIKASLEQSLEHPMPLLPQPPALAQSSSSSFLELRLAKIAKKFSVKNNDPVVTRLNTLEKSKMDWSQFVAKEGIQADLTRANKDGFIEKVAFLNRTDERQAIHISKMRKRSRA